MKTALFICIVIYAAYLRAHDLGGQAFWVDEAESTINALTIQERGLPMNQYLGKPIYENSLSIPWKESDEYEFKDSSYSDNGVAIYHAWLPLYSIAGSLKAFGVTPDIIQSGAPHATHSDKYNRLINSAARLPGVLYGSAFLLILFFAGREMGGEETGWAAFLAGAFYRKAIELSREARYYAPTVCFATLCCWLIFRLYVRGRWRDFILVGVSLALLFHTHLITFMTGALVTAVIVSIMLVRDGAKAVMPKAAVSVLIVCAVAVPWLMLTGFLQRAGVIPAARSFLQFPSDLFALPHRQPFIGFLAILTLVCAVAPIAFAKRMPARLQAPLLRYRYAHWILLGWLAAAYLIFITFMPAVSFSLERLRLPLIGPGILVVAVSCTSIAHILVRRPHLLLSAALITGAMLTVGSITLWPPTSNPLAQLEEQRTQQTIDYLRTHTFAPDTRLYAIPSQHLIFTIYTGMPIQCVAPVRKSFLDNYPGELVVLDSSSPFEIMPVDLIQSLTKVSSGIDISDARATELSVQIADAALWKRVATITPNITTPNPATSLPAYLQPLIAAEPLYTSHFIAEISRQDEEWPTMFRGIVLNDKTEWWQRYFYRFVDWENRSKANLNFRDRIRGAEATVISGGWTIYRCPRRENASR